MGLEAGGLGLSWVTRYDEKFRVLHPSLFFQGKSSFKEQRGFCVFVFWNLALLCKGVPWLCPGGLPALLGATVRASKSAAWWFLSDLVVPRYFEGLLEMNGKRSSRNNVRSSTDC